MSKEKEIQKLKELIEYHDDLYYNQDNPEISDAEYDALKKQYQLLTGEAEIADAVPGEVNAEFEEYEHTFPIKSLAKVNTIEDLRKELLRLAPGVIQPKLDGLTLVIYPDGAIVTRGNGEVGENISATASKIRNIKTYSKAPVRVEAMIDKETFNALNEERLKQGLEPFKNPRNAAAGMLRNKDISKVKGVSYRAYNIVGSDLTESNQLAILQKAGFDVIHSFRFDKDTIDSAIQRIQSFDRENFPYEIDGMVIKSDIPNALKVFGETGHHPKNMVAYKFPSQGVWTKLVDVVYQTGRTGKVTPVGIIEPTELMGSTITRVTLHNEGIMDALKVSKGCDVYLIKANDVIPAIIETRNYNPLKAFKKIKQCPVCNSELVTINDQQFCQNHDCKAKLLFNICHIAKRDALDIEGLSEETAKKMIEAGYVDHAFDIFDITEDQIKELEGFAKKSAAKLHKNIQDARQTSLKQFIYAAGIPNIGRSASEDIAKRFGSLEAFLEDIDAGCVELARIDGFGEVLIESVKTHKYLLTRLKEYVTPASEEVKVVAAPEVQLTFVITGKLEQPRKYYEALIKDAGHKVSGSVSKKTDYVLAGEAAGSKFDKAQSLGIPILNSEEELMKALQEV